MNQQTVFPVSKELFKTGKSYNYEIYRKVDEKLFRLLLKKDEVLKEEKMLLLKKENITRLFINTNDRLKFQEDIQSHLSNIIDDKSIDFDHKANLINEIAKVTVNDLFESEVSSEKLAKIDELLNCNIQFLLQDRQALCSMLKLTSYDYYTYTHCIDVATYALGFGIHLGLNKDEIKLLGKSALLHDIGKKNVKKEIISKKGKLTKDEFDEVKNHPLYTVEILKRNAETDERLLQVVLQHHEKCNGSGYPYGLKSNEIDPFAKIVAICDIFNALTTRRTYKDRMDKYEAFYIMYEKMYEEIDLSYLDEFVKFMDVY